MRKHTYHKILLFLLCINMNLMGSSQESYNKVVDYEKRETINLEACKIIGLGVLGAVAYGVLNDQVTARLCIEYFNSNAVPHHKCLLDEINQMLTSRNLKALPMDSPTIVALIWGVVATWWVGLPLGVAVAIASRFSSLLPKLEAKELVKPMFCALAFMGIGSFLAGRNGFYLAERGIRLPESIVGYLRSSSIPKEKRSFFVANAFAHEAGYKLGGLAGIGLVFWAIVKRINKKRMLDNANLIAK